MTDSVRQGSLVFDFVGHKVSGSVTTFDGGGSWDPRGPDELGTIMPVDIQPDGSFVAQITVPGAPYTGELRGRLYGPAGKELAVYWNAPVRDGYGSWNEWRAVLLYGACTTCT